MIGCKRCIIFQANHVCYVFTNSIYAITDVTIICTSSTTRVLYTINIAFCDWSVPWVCYTWIL